MNNQLAVSNQSKELIINQWSQEQLQLITNTVAKGATPDELKLFLYRCNLMRLNPLKPGQIHFIKYGNSPGTVVVGIEGFRSTSARTGKHVSTTRGVLTDDAGRVTAGWCRVKRRDERGEIQEYYEETPMEEYYNDKNPSWRKMPQSMIKKCAEAATLRMAYPDDLGGVYIEEEKDLIEKVNADGISRGGIHPEQPNADDGDPNAVHSYKFKFGSFKFMGPQEAYDKKGRKVLEDAVIKIEEKLELGQTYKGVTIAEMEEAVRELLQVLEDNPEKIGEENE